MFRKIVSNLAFSPALVGQLGFYARRLKKEETTRRLGLVFTALALVVQSLTVFTPPESANAASSSDMIYGGVTSKQQILTEYDKRRSDFKDIMDFAGITRAELANMTDKSINSKDHGTGKGAWRTWGRKHVFSAGQGEVKHTIPLDTGGSTTVYAKPLWLYDSTSYTIPNGSNYDAFVGKSASKGAFAIVKDCGNLIITGHPEPPATASFIAANCQIIRGKAVDERNKNARIKVFLYFNGPPGKGVKSDAIMTDAGSNKFAVAVPHKYKTRADSTKVWGVMVPLPGHNESTIQFENTVTIPGNCIPPKPVAQCQSLNLERINRTDFKLSARASVKNGAKIKSYRFVVVNSAGTTVITKDVNSPSTEASSGRMSLSNPGSYSARLTVKTSEGNRTDDTKCVETFRIQAPTTPAVEIDKLVDGVETKEVAVGAEFNYELRITNSGQVPLKNVLVTDPAPAGVSFLNASLGTVKNNAWSYTIPNLGVGESTLVNIRAKVTAYRAGVLTNTACVNAPEVTPGSPTQTDDCDDATVTVTPPVSTIQVCDLATKTIISIAESEFDASKHSRNLDDCKEVCTEGTPGCTQVTESKTGKNLTQGVEASSIKAQASDRIEYTVYLENIGQLPVTRTVSEELSDVLEYSTLSHNGGGTFNATSKVLAWGDITLQPGEKTSRSFVVQIMSEIPTTARGTGEPSSYDCIMTNAFGNTVDVNVACETPKMIETTVSELPKTGPGENMMFAGMVGTVVTYFWARSRQLTREVKLVRKDFNMGTI